MSFPLRMIQPELRPCGSCQACCEVLDIDETAKPAWQRCEHQCDTGCGIYSERPASCRGYRCLWQEGRIDGDERRRPDNLGLMFDFRSLDGGPVRLCATEVRRGALQEPQASYILEQLAQKTNVMIRRCP
jgi:hypothetical protein